VKDYVQKIAPKKVDEVCIWENAYDLLVSLEKQRAINLLLLLSRADPPVISEHRAKEFFREAARLIKPSPPPDRHEQAR
jgi:hypothetical protein